MKKLIASIGIIALILLLAGCGEQITERKNIQTGLAADEVDSAKYEKLFPLEYTSYQKNKEMANTEYGGSVKDSKYVREPQLPALFKGYPFEINYSEDRGHLYAIEDVTTTKRINEKSFSSCWTCKSLQVPGLIKKEGKAFYKVPFLQRVGQITHPIGCSDCHDPQTMKLLISRPGLIDAMKARGVDVTKASKNDMRALVCGQCHVEYYFEKETKTVTFPWDKGFEPEEIYAYYNEIKFSDWTHKDSQTPLIKTQHPDFETWKTGVHGRAGVTCPDCHMPYMEDGKGQKFTSHWMTSPLKTLEASCLTCHKNQGEKWVKDSVHNIQRRTFELQDAAATVLIDAHKSIADSVNSQVYDKAKVAEAQELVRKSQWFWDWVAAENGRGFHNPEQQMYILGQSINGANKALRVMEK